MTVTFIVTCLRQKNLFANPEGVLPQHLKHHLAEAVVPVLLWSSICWGCVAFGWSGKKGLTRKAGCKLSPDITSESLEWLVLDTKEADLERVVAKISVTV